MTRSSEPTTAASQPLATAPLLGGAPLIRGENVRSYDELLERSGLYREIVEKGLPDQVFLNTNDPEREVAGL